MSKKRFSRVILHVPHSSTVIPEEYRGSFLCDVEEELGVMTDLYTDELFDCEHESVVFPISRLICDVERFRNDGDEAMASKGMGAVYTRTHEGKPLRIIREGEREDILRRWYDPHHAELEGQVSKRLEVFGSCLIVDCHSFSSAPLPHEPDQSRDRPDICIGTDEYHTPKYLSDYAAESNKSLGYSVKVNSPFAGAIVPLKYYRRDARVGSVMIEINRSLYLDGTEKNGAFDKLKRDIKIITDGIADQITSARSFAPRRDNKF